MLAFEIWVDGERAMTAGAEDCSLLTFHLDARMGGQPDGNEDIRLSMSGLAKGRAHQMGDHLRWPRRSLPVGSVVTVRIVQTESPDVPLKRYRSDAEVQENPYTDDEWRQMRYEDYLAMKAEFDHTNTTSSPDE